MGNLVQIKDSDEIPEHFEQYWEEEKKKAFEKITREENLAPARMELVIENYLYTERAPLTDDILDLMNKKPGIMGKRIVAERIWENVLKFVGTFIEEMAA